MTNTKLVCPYMSNAETNYCKERECAAWGYRLQEDGVEANAQKNGFVHTIEGFCSFAPLGRVVIYKANVSGGSPSYANAARTMQDRTFDEETGEYRHPKNN